MARTACSSRPASKPGSERSVRTPLARHVRTTPAERGNWLIFSSFCSTSIEIPSREERRIAAYGDRCSSLATAAPSRGRRSIMGAGSCGTGIRFLWARSALLGRLAPDRDLVRRVQVVAGQFFQTTTNRRRAAIRMTDPVVGIPVLRGDSPHISDDLGFRLVQDLQQRALVGRWLTGDQLAVHPLVAVGEVRMVRRRLAVENRFAAQYGQPVPADQPGDDVAWRAVLHRRQEALFRQVADTT